MSIDDQPYDEYARENDLPPMRKSEWLDGIDPTIIPGRATSSPDALAKFKRDLERRERGEVVGLPWPPEWHSLESRIGPLEPSSLTVIAARPAVGKSLMGLQLLRYLAGEGKRVLYVSRELSTVRILRRHACSYGANMMSLRIGRPTQQDRNAMANYEKESRDWLAFYDDVSQSVDDVRSEVILTMPDIVIIDYLQRLAYDTEKEYAAITRIVNELQDMTLATDIPIVCLSQLSRPQKGMEWRPPTMSDVRGSGAVEERAANLIMLHRLWNTEVEERYGKEVKVAKSQSEDGFFQIEKCSDGETGSPIPVTFNGARMRVEQKP